MGLAYEPSSHALWPDERLYYTGDTWNDMQLYVPVKLGDAPQKAPEWIFARENGKYYQYNLSAKNTPAYAYVLYGEYNANETVVFGLMDASDSGVDLHGGAPVGIQRNDNGTWTAVNQPMLKMIIENSSDQEWTWDQQLQDGSLALPGQYRVLIMPNYTATFNISVDTPYVGTSDIDYDNVSLDEILLPAGYGASEYHAFGPTFKMSPSLKDDTISTMQYKAWMESQDPEKLGAACDAAEYYVADNVGFSKNIIILPSLAMHIRYNGKPSWLVFYDWGIRSVIDSDGTVYGKETDECALYHFMVFIVDDSTEKVVYYSSCA